MAAAFSLVVTLWRAEGQVSEPTGHTVTLVFFQAEMERALLQGERQAELDQIEAEADIIAQLQHKLDELESAIQREKDKVHEAVIKSMGQL